MDMIANTVELEAVSAAQAAHDRPPSPAPSSALPRLWTRHDLAEYLQRSARSIDRALARGAEESGSIPHLAAERPDARRRRDIRFDPDEIRVWLNLGCPPAVVIEQMRQITLARTRERRAY